MTMNWKQIAAVVWLVAVVALTLLGHWHQQLSLVAAVVFVAGLAVLDVWKWLAALGDG